MDLMKMSNVTSVSQGGQMLCQTPFLLLHCAGDFRCSWILLNNGAPPQGFLQFYFERVILIHVQKGILLCLEKALK